jgi:hypothetical protein
MDPLCERHRDCHINGLEGPDDVRHGSWLCRKGTHGSIDASQSGGGGDPPPIGDFPVSEGVAKAAWAVCSGYYALIAAISGWIPMMFMTRVRL